ncbi:MAG: AbrB family transcriptional regulator [Pelagimonas sp.]|uniref:AbrB family transcriptional regulator n=1 Tax=Pelagimonas sp. TaxID=2073170 RepID=UPI003D6AC572
MAFFSGFSSRSAAITLGLLGLGFLGGLVASFLSLPMPWMIGALLSSGLIVLVKMPPVLTDYAFPTPVRTVFVGLIGVMVGTQVTPELMSLASQLPLTLGLLLVYILCAFAVNMAIFQYLGRYDRATALFASAPGGLIESVLLGEAAGARIEILVVQQFLRVIVVIIWVPLGLSLWMGHPVGSAAGQSLDQAGQPNTLADIVVILTIALVGMWGATKLRLPAAPLTGPLLITAALNLSGLTSIHLPFWLVAAAQMVIGVSLGLRFKGVDRHLLKNALWLSHVSVATMLALTVLFAALLNTLTGIGFIPLFVSYAPGGLAEMAVIALSLAASPALVSLHHVARIIMTIITMPILARVLGLSDGSKT